MRSKHSNFHSEAPVSSWSTIDRTVHVSQTKFGQVLNLGNVKTLPFLRRDTNGSPTEKKKPCGILSENEHRMTQGSVDRLWRQPTQQCRLLPVPKCVGGYGSLGQPILSRKRTLVRRQIQNNDWNWKHRGILQRSKVRIDRGEFNEMT